MKLDYSLASADDLPAIYDLYMDKDANPFLTFDPMAKDDFQTIFRGLLVTQTLYIVLLNKESVASFRLIPKTHRQAHILYLGSFVVRADLKGKGLGTAILTYIKKDSLAKGYKRIELTVDTENLKAINLYKKAGFEIEGTLKKNYKLSSTNEYYDEYLMAVIL